MGRFSDSIAWCREQLGLVEEDSERYRGGDREWYGGEEVTQDRVDRADRNISLFRRLIRAYSEQDD
jgi:hypothetical protein